MTKRVRTESKEGVVCEAAGCFDLDGTWYRKQLFEGLIDVCIEAGIMENIVMMKVAELRSHAKQRKIPYDEYIWTLVRAYQDNFRLRGVRVSDMRWCAEEMIRRKGNEVHVFTRELSAAAKDVGMRRVILSGSPLQVVEAFALANDIKIFLGTEHPYDKKGYFTGGEPMQHFLHKDQALKRIAREHKIDLSRSFAIGDSRSDGDMLNVVRYPICFNPEQKLWPMARKNRWPVVIEEKNFITVYRPDKDGRLKEVPLTRVLPHPLALRLGERLKETKWYQPYFETVA